MACRPTFVGQRQFCWAHVTRNLLRALDLATTPAPTRYCREALALDRRLFRLWHRFRGDPGVRGSPLTRAQLIERVVPIEKRLFALGERYLDAATADVRNLAHAFFVHHQHFFTFVHEEGVAPTNNAAERALRTAVQWRKIMFGTRSAQGERAVRTPPDDRADLSAPGTQRPRVLDRRHRRASSSPSSCLIAAPTSDPLNCYLGGVVREYVLAA